MLRPHRTNTPEQQPPKPIAGPRGPVPAAERASRGLPRVRPTPPARSAPSPSVPLLRRAGLRLSPPRSPPGPAPASAGAGSGKARPDPAGPIPPAPSSFNSGHRRLVSGELRSDPPPPRFACRVNPQIREVKNPPSPEILTLCCPVHHILSPCILLCFTRIIYQNVH